MAPVALPSLPAVPLPVLAERAEERPAPRAVAVLEPVPGGVAERLANRLGATHPVRVFLATIVGGYALLVALTVTVGLVLTTFLVPMHGFEKWDNDINRWLAERRTPWLTDLSWLGSTFAGGLVIPVVVGVLLLVFVVRRSWLLAAFTLFVISVESGSYRATTLVVHRDRPPVHRLEGLAPDASLPSGHIAATIALYGGLLLLLASWVGRRWFSTIAVVLAVALALFVGWARMYRGMHHVTDTAAGVLMGLAALGLVVLAARAATAAADARDAARGEAS
jgi:membrane-associated phospholipid phosphatase